jgi:Zn-dependent peptidase ImmA (M78 family)
VLSGYNLTETERKIETMYKEREILTPSDLEIKNVANLFNVELDFSFQGGPQRAIWDDELSVIFLDPGESEEKQREVFFHELGHPILHCGDQTKMEGKAFRKFQEAQANQFQLYAAIPFFMLKQLDLPDYEYQIIGVIKNTFKVTESLARKRLEQIKRRLLQSKIDKNLLKNKYINKKESIENMESYPVLEDLFSTNEIKQFFTPKRPKRNKVYFDYHNGRAIPLWYTIEINPGRVNWGKDTKLFPIDADFELTHHNQFENNDKDVHVFKSELSLQPSYPNDFAIDLKSLKNRMKLLDVDPYNIRRFVLSVTDLERLLELPIVSSRLTNLPFNGLFCYQ